MNRRAWMTLGWSSAWLASAVLASPSLAVEFRGGKVPRGTHRLAALQTGDDGDSLIEPMQPETEPAMPEETPEVIPSAKPKGVPAPSAPSMAAPQQVPQHVPAPYSPPMSSNWDQGVISGGECSDGTCEECPTYGGGFGCNGGWGSVDYLLWWREARQTPSLITTSVTANDRGTDGQIGQADTRILLGNAQYTDHLQPGGRFDVGMWFDACQSVGVGTRITFLADDEFSYTTSSVTHAVLAVPFFNLDPLVNGQDTLLVAHPADGSTGSITVSGVNEVNLGDVYMRIVGARTDRYRVDMLAGYSFSNILEDLNINTNTNNGGTNVLVRDRFYTKNGYQGGVLGLMTEVDRGSWKVNVLAKVALTNVQQSVIVDGSTTIGGVVQAPLSGLFAQPSNSGTIVQNRFAAIPEFGINFVHRVGCNASVTAGYSCIYWSETARPGDQINRRIDPTQVTNRPAQVINSGDYFVQGFNFGVAWDY